MAHFECATCNLAAGDREAVEAKIVSGMKFRELAALTGISKSSLHRHAVNCMERNRLRALKQRRGAPGTSSSLSQITSAGPAHCNSKFAITAQVRCAGLNLSGLREIRDYATYLEQSSFFATSKTK